MSAGTVGLVGPSPPPNGGMALQTRQLRQMLESDGQQVEFLSSTAEWKPSFVGRIPVLRALWRLLPFLVGVWRLAGRVDVIHLMANSGWSWQLYAAPVLWLAPWRGTPVIVNYRGGYADEYFTRSITRVRPSMDRASAIVVPSMFLHKVFARYGMHAEVIPNVVDRTIFNPGDDPSNATDHFTIAITRNLERIYGIDTAIMALTVVLQEEPTARLRIAGSGPERAALQALAEEQGVAQAVSFEGRLERGEIVALYREADILLNPTTVDNMPASVIEAMACGTPVVSTDVGGVPYILSNGETGLLVPVGQPTAMAAAILRLRRDSALAEGMVQRALHEVAQYSWDNVGPRWRQLYAVTAGSQAL